jgi:hypothetical protein
MEHAYPNLSDLMGAWFHQDFDIEGNTVVEVVEAYKRVTPPATQTAVREDITKFLNDHADDVDGSFERIFNPDIIPSVLSGSTRGFLDEIRSLMPSQ